MLIRHESAHILSFFYSVHMYALAGYLRGIIITTMNKLPVK